MEIRKCRYCNEEYPIDFYEKANTIKGKTYRRWKCRNCYREMKKERICKLRIWLTSLRKTLKCKECGEDRYYILDFHHKDNHTKETSISLAYLRGWGKERILTEIDKCDVYCSNCHRELHHFERLKQK